MPNVILTQPTAYVCRGCRVPVFNELPDLPYAIVFKESAIKYTIAYSATPIAIETNDSGEYLLAMGNPHCFYRYDTRANTDWVQGSVYEYATRYTMSSYQNPIWSTHKVVYPNGTLFIDKSDPPSSLYEGFTEKDDGGIDLYSWTVGLIMGMSDRFGLIQNSMYEDDNSGDGGDSSSNPVAYLYSGVRLPEVQVWKGKKYDSALGGYVEVDTGTLIYKPSKYNTENAYYYIKHPNVNYLAFEFGHNSQTKVRPKCTSPRFKLQDNEWTENGEFTPVLSSDIELTDVVWTNYDILYDDGTVAFAATEPVPVYR